MLHRTFIALFALALVTRLAAVLALLNVPIALDDMFQYDMLARSIAEGRGFRWYMPHEFRYFAKAIEPWHKLDPADYDIPPEGVLTTFRAPLYPAFLSIVYSFSDPAARITAARVVQAALGATLAPLTAWLALVLGASRRGATIAGAVLAVYPILTLFPVALATENLFFPLSLLATILLLRAVRHDRVPDYGIAGAAFGFAMLTRSIIGAAFVPAVLWSWTRGCPNSRRGTVALLAGAILVASPWAVRNSIIAGKPTPIETSMGYNLFLGYHPEGDGGFTTDLAVQPLFILDDAERDEFTTRAALNFIRKDPARVPELMLRKFAVFWGFEDRALIYFYSNGLLGYIPSPWLQLAYLALVLPLVLVVTLAVPGLVFAPDRPGALLVLGMIGGYTLVHVLLFAEDRFHLVLVPFLAVYAGQAVASGRRLMFSVRVGGRGRWALTAFVITVFLAVWGWEVAQQWPKYLLLASPDGWKLGWSY